MNIPVNIFRTLERPVLNLIRQSSTAKKVLENPAKDDPTQHHFSLKQKAETIHHVLGINVLQFILPFCVISQFFVLSLFLDISKNCCN
jgi:Icc-related predicted phosphoesterase